MQLVLIRHAEAAHPPQVTDSKRPLTERGHTQAEETGKYLKDLIQPEVLLSVRYYGHKKPWSIFKRIS